MILEVKLLGELRFKLEIDLLEDVEDTGGGELVCEVEISGGVERTASMLCDVEIVHNHEVVSEGEVGREEKSLVDVINCAKAEGPAKNSNTLNSFMRKKPRKTMRANNCMG